MTVPSKLFSPDSPILLQSLQNDEHPPNPYAEAFRDYEARLETGALPERNPPGKAWRGERYVGQTLLVVSEQGYGDTIWASRYLERVKALGGTLIVECRKDMVPLIESMHVADRVIAKGAPFSPADVPQTASNRTPRPSHVMAGLVPAIHAFLSGDNVSNKPHAFEGAGGKLKVGILWSGSTSFKGNQDRAVKLRMFLDAFVLPGVQLYSLQKGPPAEELKAAPNAPIIDLGPAMADFADAAAIVSELDLIIMTDSAVAHLAGAMGKKVWLLLNYGPYWIWSDLAGEICWYGSIELLRQQVWADWRGPFDLTAQKLLSSCDLERN